MGIGNNPSLAALSPESSCLVHSYLACLERFCNRLIAPRGGEAKMTISFKLVMSDIGWQGLYIVLYHYAISMPRLNFDIDEADLLKAYEIDTLAPT
jgi:hypothetical protein